MSNLRVGVVGGGHFGRYHTKNYSEHPKADLVGVADVNPEVAKRVADEFGCRAFGSYEEFVDEVDAVSVAVPTQFHYEVAGALLDVARPLAPIGAGALWMMQPALGFLFGQPGHQSAARWARVLEDAESLARLGVCLSGEELDERE